MASFFMLGLFIIADYMQFLDIRQILTRSQYDSIFKVHSPSDFLVLLVRISPTETQSFLLSKDLNYIYLQNDVWAEQIISIVSQVLQRQPLLHSSLDRHVVLLGVWHFGHLLGDHSWNIIFSHKAASSYPLIKLSDPTVFDIGKNLLLDNLSTEELDCDACLLTPSRNTLILPPSTDPSHAMAMSSTYVQSRLKQLSIQPVPKSEYIFLTSDRESRISNISHVRSILKDKFLFVNPLNIPVVDLYSILADCTYLVSENGSILFNVFMSRVRSYFVFASDRCQSNSFTDDYYGGYIYNQFHDSLVQYLYSPCIRRGHHPYSDQITIGYNNLNFLLSL